MLRVLSNQAPAMAQLISRLEGLDMIVKSADDQVSTPGEEAGRLVHGLADIEDSMTSLFGALVPALLTANPTEDQTEDIFLGIQDEYRHILYHVRDATPLDMQRATPHAFTDEWDPASWGLERTGVMAEALSGGANSFDRLTKRVGATHWVSHFAEYREPDATKYARELVSGLAGVEGTSIRLYSAIVPRLLTSDISQPALAEQLKEIQWEYQHLLDCIRATRIFGLESIP